MRRIDIKLILLLCLLFTCVCFADSYTVQSGDTLSSIAKKELGSSSRWKEIAELNGLSDPYVIRRGQVLKISGDSAGDDEAANDLEELIRSSGKANGKPGNEKSDSKLFGGKVKPIWFLPAAGIGVVILIIVGMFLLSSLALYLACKLLSIKGSFGKCFLITIAAQGGCLFVQYLWLFTVNPLADSNLPLFVSFFFGIGLLGIVIHIFLIKQFFKCKVSKAFVAYLLSIAFSSLIGLVFYLIIALIMGVSFAVMG